MRACVIAAIATLAAAAAEAAPPLPSPAEAQAVCRFVAARGPAIAASLMSSGLADADHDGVDDAVAIGRGGGTMGGETPEFRPRGATRTAPPVAVTSSGFQGADYLALGARWLRFGGRTYALYFDTESLRRASHLTIVDRDRVEHLVCDFAPVEREKLRRIGRVSAGLCREVVRGRVAVLPVTPAEPGPTGRPGTVRKGLGTVDFRNTGRPAALVLLGLESGAGRGCAAEYFDAAAGDVPAASGPDHDVLMAVQRIDPAAFRPLPGGCGGNAVRWFRYRGGVYLDNASRRDATRAAPFHEVVRIDGAAVKLACRATFAVQWRVKSIGAAFK